jgi:hypothetical protein
MKYKTMKYKTIKHKPLKCIDCDCYPWDIGEDFLVNDGLWIFTMPINKRNGIICIKCFEKRLGRKLKRKDFKSWFRNNRWYGDRRRKLNNPPSDLLINRLNLYQNKI